MPGPCSTPTRSTPTGATGPTCRSVRSTIRRLRRLAAEDGGRRGPAVLHRRRSRRRRPVGVASYLRIDPAAGSIEVGHINFSPLAQRTRAATDTMFLMMREAFALGYRRYEWKCDALNAPSRVAAERLGFTFEGIFRQATDLQGRAAATRRGTRFSTRVPGARSGVPRLARRRQLRRRRPAATPPRRPHRRRARRALIAAATRRHACHQVSPPAARLAPYPMARCTGG